MAVPFIDIHTHQLPQDEGVVSIVNLELAGEVPCAGLYSQGIHPWSLDAADFEVDSQLRRLETGLLQPNVVAVGEAGLDRAHKSSFERQLDVFQRQIAFSERHGKPMIIHNVRCSSEIMAIRKRLATRLPWILHGFNGGLQEVCQFVRQDMCFSIGASLLHPDRSIRETLASIPLDRLFFETDTAPVSVESIYQEAALLLAMPIVALQKQIFVNFARIFGNDYGRLAR